MTNSHKYLKWIEISKSALSFNLQQLKKNLKPKTKLATLLKANAYGHGFDEIADLYRENGIDFFLLHQIEEAKSLRHQKFKERLLLLGPLFLDDIKWCQKNNVEVTVASLDFILKLNTYIESNLPPLKIHLKIETGTHRQGLNTIDLKKAVSKLKKIENIHFQGISSHFANIEDSADDSYYKYQLNNFNLIVEQLAHKSLLFKERHMSCSAAVLLHPKTHMEFVRPGISVFGYLPSVELNFALKNKVKLKPVLQFKTKVTELKIVEKNQFIGYGLTYKTTRKTLLGIIPVGYSDGLNRHLSNKGYVLVNGKRAPLLGRICMNLSMIDLTDIKGVKYLNNVTIIGKDKNETLYADEISSQLGTISYDVLSSLSSQIKRIVI